MKILRLTLFTLMLSFAIVLLAHAQLAYASDHVSFDANRQSVGILQVAPTTVPTNQPPAVTVVVTNQVTTAPSGGSNAGLIIGVIVLVLIILTGIIISSRRPHEPV